MKRARAASVAVVWAVAIACAGCDSAPTQPTDAGIDVPPPPPPDCTEHDASCSSVLPPYEGACLTACGAAPRAPRTGDDGGTPPTAGPHYFILDSIVIDSSDSDPTDPHTTVRGFDLDGRASDDFDDNGCNKLDLYPKLDRDQTQPACCNTQCSTCRPSVDNQLVDFADVPSSTYLGSGFDARRQLSTDLAGGQLLTVIALTDVEDWTDDADVGIEMYRAFDTDADCANTISGDGTVALDAASFDGASPPQPRWHSRGRLVGGQFYTATPFDGPGVWIAPASVDVRPVHELRLRFSVSADGRVLGSGNAGGWLAARELVDLWTSVSPDNGGIFAQVLGNYVDLPLNPDTMQIDSIHGICYERAGRDGGAARFGGLSEGFGFTAVRVNVAGTATAPPAGACGAGP